MTKRSIYTEREIRSMSDEDLISRYCIIVLHGTFTRPQLERELKRRNIL